MTTQELLDALQTGIEALAVAPINGWQCYYDYQEGQLPASRVLIEEPKASEDPRGISAGVGMFDEEVSVEIRAEFEFADTAANKTKAYAALAQLKKFVRDNRRIVAGGDTCRYATYTDARIDGPYQRAPGENEKQWRGASLTATFKVPSDT